MDYMASLISGAQWLQSGRGGINHKAVLGLPSAYFQAPCLLALGTGCPNTRPRGL